MAPFHEIGVDAFSGRVPLRLATNVPCQYSDPTPLNLLLIEYLASHP